MEQPMRAKLSILILLAATALPALGGASVLQLDPKTTRVTFELPATGHDVEGVVGLERGEVDFDPASGAASGEIVLDAAGAETGNGSRDKTMRQDVLDVLQFPTIRFLPAKIVGTVPEQGTGAVTLHGIIELHGAQHPLALPARITVENGVVAAEATFQIPYQDWGLHDPSVLFLRVARIVEVTVHAKGTLAPEQPAAASPAAR